MTDKERSLTLPEDVTDDALALIVSFFQDNTKLPVRVSAQEVKRVGSRCLQALMSAQLQWRSDGTSFAVVDANDAFLEDLTILGLDPDFFDMEPPNENQGPCN